MKGMKIMSFSLFEDLPPPVVELSPTIELAPVSSAEPEIVEITEKAEQSSEVDQPNEAHADLDNANTVGIALEPEPSLVEIVAKRYQDGLDEALRLRALFSAPTKFLGVGFSPFADLKSKIPDEDDLHFTIFKDIVANAKATGLAAPGDYNFEQDFQEYKTGSDDYYGRRRRDEKVPVKTDILGLCNAIHAAYGGANGKDAEYRRIARNIISAFALESTKIEVKAGFVELSQRSWLQKNYRNQYEWDYSCRRTYLALLGDLSELFGKSGMHFGMGAFIGALSAHSDPTIEPNKTKFDGYINDYPVRVKVQKEELRWRFAPECVEVISDFVTEFGPEMTPGEVSSRRR
jgi:hypothetical protein